MQKKQFFPLALIAVAILSGCSSSSPPQNAALTAAHSSYNSARSNPDVTSLAALELKVLHQMHCEISRNVREFRFSNTPMPS